MKKLSYVLWFVLVMFSSCNAQEKDQGVTPVSGIDIDELQNKKQSQYKTDSSAFKYNSKNYSSPVDFRYAAKTVTPAVVHIMSTYLPEREWQSQSEEKDFYHGFPDPFKDFFKDDPFFHQFEFRTPQSPQYQPQPRQAAGSGVIITDDGYILTNNHVINQADEIKVVLYDRRSYDAIVIGTDPQTDLALIKIEEKALPFVVFGNSDNLEVGEWVVAVGNPFNLASTVTAGIVSAKARNINIIKGQGAIESFIQTDAVVNPGNSGGALVTLDGKLIGINTAIATPTGVYAGYAFAIPSNITKKIVNDLLNYGVVQRGFLGIIIRDLNGELAEELELDITTGVYVESLMADGAAKKAGIKEKDVIIKIDGIDVKSTPKLQELVARKRPGDKVKITLIRNGNTQEIEVTLKSREGKTELVKNERKEILQTLGIELEELSSKEKREYDVSNGLKVTKLYSGKIKKHTDMREGFIITKVNNKSIKTIEDFTKEVEGKTGGIILEGKYPDDPLTYYYAFGL